jgi:putative SOS response-associated peptidase YedK
MCGRYTRISSPRRIAGAMGVAEESAPELLPQFNLAPSQLALAVAQDMVGARHFGTLRWGLVEPVRPGAAGA